jgi:hypothetical protein
MTLTPLTGIEPLTTVIVAIPALPLEGLVAVMFAVPAATPVTVPFPLTAATELLLEDHVMF